MVHSIKLRVGTAILIAIWCGGCTPAAPPSPPAAVTPRPKAPPKLPADGKAAFLAGYAYFNQKDSGRAIPQLEFAESHYPALGDYALYYLGLARRDNDDLNGAVDALQRLESRYPQSALRDRGDLALAQVLYKLGRNNEAAAAASRLITRAPVAELDREAQLVEARAQIALGNPKAAYENAMVLRTRYPLSDEDAMAREIAYAVIAANPGVADARSVKYHREESELLLREGAISKAAVQAQSGLAIATNPGDRAELTYTLARALKPNPADAAREFLKYLRIAPRGPDAPAALEKLALIYWHDDRDELARGTFGRIVAEFPHSRNAPGAMLRIGRIFEEQHQLGRARAQYKRVAARYPSSEAGETARFRAPWMLYMGHDYSHAAAEFGVARKRASSGSERDRCDYWRARSLEKAGDASGALAIFSKVALSVESNYYPALAARRAAGSRPELPAATISESVFDAPAPAVASEIEQFHLDRLATLRALNLKQLEPDELRALHEAGGGSSAMSRFVLGGYIRAGAWHDSIAMALRMEKSRELDRAAAERAAYPRGYWDLIAPAAARRALDPYMLLALMRQESLFNPRATSASNARGLMQLLPSTAARVATQEAIESGNLDLYDPPLNVTLGTAYLAQLFAMFGGDEFKAVAAYNGGEHAVQKWTAEFPGSDDEWVENIAYAETRDYVKRVIGGRREYQLLYQAPSGSGAR